MYEDAKKYTTQSCRLPQRQLEIALNRASAFNKLMKVKKFGKIYVEAPFDSAEPSETHPRRDSELPSCKRSLTTVRVV